jgi:hypothetical protein
MTRPATYVNHAFPFNRLAAAHRILETQAHALPEKTIHWSAKKRILVSVDRIESIGIRVEELRYSFFGHDSQFLNQP